MKPPLRIAVLECGEPTPATKEKFGTYTAVFAHMLQAGAELLKRDDISATKGLEITGWNVETKDQYPPLEDIDAVLMTGSKHNAFDADPWIEKLVKYTQTLLKQDRVRILGACFGHQILGRALGAPVARSTKGWEVSVLPIELTGKGKELFQTDKLALHQMHQDIIVEAVPEAEALGYSPLCEVQGMYKKGKYMSVQGHPEFDADIVKDLLKLRKEAGIFTEEVYSDGWARVEHPHDGILVGAAFLRFLLED